MDETWQRHKTFILQCLIGGVVFLVALLVLDQMYSGADDPQELSSINERKQKTLLAGVGPSLSSIREQQQFADKAEGEIRVLAGQIASMAPTQDAYVRENIDTICALLGEPGEADRFFGLYGTLPQTCLTSLQGFVRDKLVGRAAQLGRELDESMGITSSFQDDEVPVGIHGLMIVTDVVTRCLDRNDLEGVEAITILASAGGTRRGGLEDESKSSHLRAMRVRLTLVGDPTGVQAVLRSFDDRSGRLQRNVVVDRIGGVQRPRPASDTIKMALDLAGLWYVDDSAKEEKL